MDKVWIRNFILSVVKPLKSGKIISQNSDLAACDNLMPDGGADGSFRLTSPFGLISGIPRGVTAFYQSLFGSGFENIIIALLHKLRPSPLVGQTILYSTDSTGTTIQVTISLNPDGTLVIASPEKVTVISPETDVNSSTVNINGNATISGSLNVSGTITAPTVDSNTIVASSQVTIAGIPFTTHKHIGVTSGTSTSGGPTS